MPVPFMRSFAGPFLPMTLARSWPNSFALPLFQMSVSGTFSTVCRNYCFPESVGLLLRAEMWYEYISSMTFYAKNYAADL